MGSPVFQEETLNEMFLISRDFPHARDYFSLLRATRCCSSPHLFLTVEDPASGEDRRFVREFGRWRF